MIIAIAVFILVALIFIVVCLRVLTHKNSTFIVAPTEIAHNNEPFADFSNIQTKGNNSYIYIHDEGLLLEDTIDNVLETLAKFELIRPDLKVISWKLDGEGGSAQECDGIWIQHEPKKSIFIVR
mgnify:CR=1 FL=1